MEQKDFSKEYEDMPDPTDLFNDSPPIENFLSVTEQIRNISYHKDNSPEERLILMLEGKFNPFLKANFNELQLAHSSNIENVPLRNYPAADKSIPPSFHRENFEGAPFKGEYKMLIDDKV